MSIICHHEVFHDSFASPHDVHRIGGFIGRNAKEVLRGIDTKEVHQFLGLNVIVLDERLNGIFILL